MLGLLKILKASFVFVEAPVHKSISTATYLFIYLAARPGIYLIQPPTHLPLYCFIHPPILRFHPPTHSSAHPSILYQPIYLSIRPSIYPSTHPICMPTHPPINPSIYPSTHPPSHLQIHSSNHPIQSNLKDRQLARMNLTGIILSLLPEAWPRCYFITLTFFVF